MRKKTKFPFNHVVLEDRKEVWIKRGYPSSMGVPAAMKQFYPGYTSHLARNEFIEELKVNPEARNKLDI
jgi:hypothetical protein